MKKNHSYLTLALAFLGSALSASAHPGHSLGDASVTHLVTSPDHLLVLALAGVALSVAGRFVQTRVSRWTLHGMGALALISSMVLLGLRA